MGAQQLKIRMPSTILINYFISLHGNRAIENTNALNYPEQLFHQLAWELGKWEYGCPQLS